MPLSQVTESLVARTVEIDGEIDLLDVAGDDGVLFEWAGGLSVAGAGVAARVPVRLGTDSAAEEVATALSRIRCDDSHPPLAIGALPFSPTVSGEMVVPAVVVRRHVDGSCWLTMTAPERAPTFADVRKRIAGRQRQARAFGPQTYQVDAPMDQKGWCRLVVDTTKRVADGQLAKVVLAREVTVRADQAFLPSEVARRLRLSHPSCMVFSVDGFVGASPELLVERRGEIVRSQPLAGTAARDGTDEDESAARVLSSAKERQEHALVVDAVHAALSRYCEQLPASPPPSVVRLGPLAHLGTPIRGRLRHPLPTALALVDAIHPSPAVGGSPRAMALDHIAAVEALDRGRYGGPVGWVDAAGDGCWAVGIRAAQIEGRRARLMAGAGILAGSDPQAELAETQLKLGTMLGALIRP